MSLTDTSGEVTKAESVPLGMGCSRNKTVLSDFFNDFLRAVWTEQGASAAISATVHEIHGGAAATTPGADGHVPGASGGQERHCRRCPTVAQPTATEPIHVDQQHVPAEPVHVARWQHGSVRRNDATHGARVPRDQLPVYRVRILRKDSSGNQQHLPRHPPVQGGLSNAVHKTPLLLGVNSFQRLSVDGLFVWFLWGLPFKTVAQTTS